MPPEPKKPIEDLLEASARARRESFGPAAQMPNPMRARLHDEIARVERDDTNKAERRQGLSIWWPRLTLAGALAVIVVGGPVLWLHRGTRSGDESLKLAIREPAAPSTAVISGAEPAQETVDAVRMEQPASAAVAVAPLRSTEGSLADNKTVTAAAPAESAATTEEVASNLQKFAAVTIPPAANMPNANNNFKDEGKLAKKVVTSAAGSVALAPGRKPETANFRQQFSQYSINRAARNQSARFNSKLKQAISVLTTFQIEQNGTQIRIVDADGSAYTGKIEPLAQKNSRARAVPQQGFAPTASAESDSARRSDDGQTNNVEFSFRASGYSGSLKKKLVFEGNYISSALPQEKETRAGAKKAAAPSQEQTQARIVGIARISGESPVPIDAVSVGP
jgi:hypothetical protein